MSLNNKDEYIYPYDYSDINYAREHYKKRACYNCAFKRNNHQGDIVIGDYWGCTPDMEEYDCQGVSIIFQITDKGNFLIQRLRLKGDFLLYEADTEYALACNSPYYKQKSFSKRWLSFNKDIKKHGLKVAVNNDRSVYKSSMRSIDNCKIVLWGAGNCYYEMTPYLLHKYKVS